MERMTKRMTKRMMEKWTMAALGQAMVLVLSTAAFGQTSTATVSGTAQDTTGAFIPGVTVTATNDATGVDTSTVTNSAGAYNIPALQPGTYTVTAELTNFQTARFTEVLMRTSAQIRLDFDLQVAGAAAAVEVSVSADDLLIESGPSVGEALEDEEVQALPLVGGNVLDLVQVMAGVNLQREGDVFGAETTTFAGVSAMNVNVVRDGVSIQDQRWPNGISGTTVLNPELVSGFQMILAPVDAEMGRGSGQIQLTTRSGTNEFHGAGVWDVQNSALDANSWDNNRSGASPNWRNNQEYSISLGGPIVEDQTFFYVLWDQQISGFRTTQNPIVPTPCALNGIFRFYDNWNNGNALQTTAGGANPTIAVVNRDGSLKPPAMNPDATPHNGLLRYASVWGPITNIPAVVDPDCGNITVDYSDPWDPNRTNLSGLPIPERTGYLQMMVDEYLPAPNNYDVGDGLNAAGHRWVRGQNGSDGIFGTGTATNRKQINLNIDHVLNEEHNISGSYTYETNNSDSALPPWPAADDFRGLIRRRPQVLAVNFVSTVSPTVVNEVRFGMARSGVNSFSELDDPDTGTALQALLPTTPEGVPFIPALGTGQYAWPGGFFGAPGGGIVVQAPVTSRDNSPRWSLGDTMSWSRGRHGLRFGATYIIANSKTENSGEILSNTNSLAAAGIPTAIGGESVFAQTEGVGFGIGNLNDDFNSNRSPDPGVLMPNNETRMQDLIILLDGSTSQVVQRRFVNTPEQFASGVWNDPAVETIAVRDVHQNEFSAFFKDDWKVTNALTLNLGVRWDYYGVPYDENGMAAGFVDGGVEMLGMTGRSLVLEDWYNPGENAPDAVVTLVGPNSLNPGLRPYAREWNNFGPAVGFAYQLGAAGRTTLRGGYQASFLGGGRGDVVGDILGQPAGGTSARSQNAGVYFDVQDVSDGLVFPVPAFDPGDAIPRYDRGTRMVAFDSNLVSPYIQNLTLSLAHRIGRNLILEGKYIGTLTRKMWGNLDLNEANFLFNGMLEELAAARRGDESQMLDDLFYGIDMGSGVIGVDAGAPTGAEFLRTSPLFLEDLALGDFNGLANTLSRVNYDPSLNPTLPDWSLIDSSYQGSVLGLSEDVSGDPIPGRTVFPDNFLQPNPQFGDAFLQTNRGHSNYHSFQGAVTLRPTYGVNLQATYTWQKDLGLPTGDNNYTAPYDLSRDYALTARNRSHQFRTYGTFSLPIGPGQSLFGNATGPLARITEGWQMSWILNLLSGIPARVVAQPMIFGLGAPDLVGDFDLHSGNFNWEDGALAGNFFDARYTGVRDPQCSNPIYVDPALAGSGFGANCDLEAIQDTETGQLVFQHPLPGQRGNFGLNNLTGVGSWTTDMAISKRTEINENVSMQVRVDATNIFNHPEPFGAGGFFATEGPVLSMNSFTPFGQLGLKQGSRTFQMKARLDF